MMYKSILNVVGMAVAVSAALLIGCSNDNGDKNNPNGPNNTGGGLVGDWAGVSEVYCKDGVCESHKDEFDGDTFFISFNSSGALISMSFEKVGDIWIVSDVDEGTWHTSGNILYLCDDDCSGLEYSVSGNTLTTTNSRQGCDGSGCHSYSSTLTFVRTNIASVKSSLGVYSSDPALHREWQKPSESGYGNDWIVFGDGRFYDEGGVYFSDDDYYVRASYTEGSRLILLGLNCNKYEKVEDHGYEYEKCVSASIAKTVTLDYSITTVNGVKTLRLRPTGSSTWDVWTPYENDGMYKLNATPNTKKDRFAVGSFRALRR